MTRGKLAWPTASAGLACCRIAIAELQAILQQVQNELFVLGADLASPSQDQDSPQPDPLRRISPKEISSLESAIDRYNEALPPLQEFILPGGSELGALLHLARAVARRAERAAVRLAESEKINPQALIYLNRLSDLLFVLARVVNRQSGSQEISAQFH